ncbi:hypothetical protein [Umezawaea sp. Da 62-37]|uniref:hypothetical protein n=1 Tax=Umezawaea sp. Da 62-37 TaxID=3075927 RepID=UPI0028F6D521|nr:hypothetical protein [Umezawaea sp. Da 62-37]WNV83715.1 hypothetical protein RM788_36865 [Umezawaea sp. Da 62-37]
MWTTLAPALVAAAAALGGVTVGALVEPLKLGAARRARIRDDRAMRCAKLIEAAMTCRARLLALNLAHRRAAAGFEVDTAREDELVEVYRQTRSELRQTVALLRLSGPDELVEVAMTVREAERALRGVRFVGDDGGDFDKDKPPLVVLAAAHALEDTVHEFAATARRLVAT